MAETEEAPIPLTQADARIVNIVLDVLGSLQGLGVAVEVLASQSKIANENKVRFDEGIKRFSEKRDAALKAIKDFVEPHLTK